MRGERSAVVSVSPEKNGCELFGESLVFVVRCVVGDVMMTRPSPCGLGSALMLAGTEPQEVSEHRGPSNRKTPGLPRRGVESSEGRLGGPPSLSRQT